MSQQFVKGYTNNHLTWVMVDATDFATPESALSGAIIIRKYGKLKGDNTVYTVGSSGQGSLTNDIKHVGASATGIYTIGLVKADLSDASAAWYDQYIFDISAAGAARQCIIVDGGIWISDLSAIASDIRSDVSDMHSDLIVMSDVLSDFLSDFQSRVPKRVATDSQLSALHSDLDSAIVSQTSDLKSAIAAGPAATITASDISDIASAVWAAKYFGAAANNVASSFGSMLRVRSSDISDIDSMLTAMSDILSNVNSLAILIQTDTSNIASRITGAVATASDVASKVWAEKYTAAGNNTASTFGSLFRVQASNVSDIDSMLTSMSDVLSDFLSDFQSRVPKRVATDSQLSALHSDLDSAIVSTASDIRSLLAIGAGNSGILSDIYSLLSDVSSDLAVMSGILSDVNSAVTSVGFKKNTAITDFEFLLVDSTDHVTPKTGMTVTATRSLDGAAFGACANAVAELSNGIYVIDLAAGDLNANIVTFRFTAVGADDRYVTIKTQP